MRRHCVRLVAGPMAVLFALTVVACDGDDEPDEEGTNGVATQAMLLTEDDVQGASGAKDVDELSPSTFCSPIGRAESRLLSYADGEFSVREIAVDMPSGEVTVDSAVFDVRRGALRSVLFTNGFELGVTVCSSEPAVRAGQTEQMIALEGLPAGAVGFSSGFTGGDQVEQVTRAYAMVGTRVVVVGARRSGAGQIDIPVAELLATAIAKVEAEGARQDT